MDDDRRNESLLPGSRDCVGCGGMTFRRRDDALCPRCAFDAEALIERIELDCLDNDLRLITEFEAYYRRREQARERYGEVAGRPVFASRRPLGTADREPVTFPTDAFWTELREAG